MTSQPHQLSIPAHLQQTILHGQNQAQVTVEQKTPSPAVVVNVTSKGVERNNANQLQVSAIINTPSQKPQIVQNVYSNAYSKKSTADVIRNRINVSSPSKKKAGQHFSHSDEMQYKRSTQLRDFTILKKLGDGAYSSVYLVKRIEDGQQYALKKVKIGAQSHKDKENAINEVRILANIRHPNVVDYKEAFIDNESQSLNLVMQLADGGDLLRMISDRKKRKVHFRESQVWRVLIETVYGLRAMHEIRVMHRDIKSANIFLFRNSEVRTSHTDGGNLYQAKLGDMNVSKVTNQNGLNYTQTGTPYYASPEVWKDEPYGYKSDIWSLGCVIYEMLSLKPPFSGRDMDHLYKRVCKGIFPRIPEHYSNDIWAIVQLMLRVDSSKRPDCDQLIASKMFQIYTEKLNSLDSVDFTFQKTLKSASPDRVQITNITNSLLTQLHLPANDIGSLTNILPRRNYESAQTQKEKVSKGGTLLKTTSVQMEESHQLSATSRKLQQIRSVQQQQSRQMTQLQSQANANPNEQSSAAKNYEQPGNIDTTQVYNSKPGERDNSLVARLQEDKTPSPRKKQRQTEKRDQKTASVKDLTTPKMTKIQSKLQRQYLQTKDESVVGDRSESNPTVITNRSNGSKKQGQQSSVLKQHEIVSTERVESNHGMNIIGGNSLRARLTNKRKNLPQEGADEMDSSLKGSITGSQRKQVLSKKNGITKRQDSGEEHSQNLSPLKSPEGYDHTNISVSPIMIGGSSPSGSNEQKLKQARLSLPLVSDRSHGANPRLPSSLPVSQDSTPINAKVALHFGLNSNQHTNQQKMGTAESGELKNQVTSLPQLSEIESANISTNGKNEANNNMHHQNVSTTKASSRAMPNVNNQRHLNNNNQQQQSLGSYGAVGYNINVKSDCEMLHEDQYQRNHVNGTSDSQNYKIGKRHASLDVLVPQGQHIFQAKQSLPSNMLPVHLISSQGALIQLNNDMAIKSSRLPESQSYSQINMMNKIGLGVAVAKHGSTSSSEDPQQIKHIAFTNMTSDVSLKHQLRKRYNNVGNQHSGPGKANAHDQFSKNQQHSVRHQQSDANFSLNSDDLRHGGFQQNGQIVEESKLSSARRLIESNKIMKLPQIETRKKSYEPNLTNDYRSNKVPKLQNHIIKQQQAALITKKKPGNGLNQQLYNSMISGQAPQQITMAQNLQNSSTHVANLANYNLNSSSSPNKQSNSNIHGVGGIKKKTLAAYSNPRVRNNNRNNLIYTQKQSI